MSPVISIAVGDCDNCGRAWPLSMIRSGSCSSGEAAFCPLCIGVRPSVDAVADALDEALTPAVPPPWPALAIARRIAAGCALAVAAAVWLFILAGAFYCIVWDCYGRLP